MGQTERGHKTTGGFGTRWLALLLSLAMLVGMMPGMAFGDEGQTPEIVLVEGGETPPEGDGDGQQDAITFSGIVKDRATQAGLPGADITVYAAGGAQLGTAKSGANGAWSLAKAAEAGSYYCTVQLAGYTFAPAQSAQKELAADATALAFDAFAGDEVLPDLGFTGIVATAEGGLAGVAVMANSAGSVVAQATTDTTGAFGFTALPYAEDYTFTYELADYTIDTVSSAAVTKDVVHYTLAPVTAVAAEPPVVTGGDSTPKELPEGEEDTTTPPTEGEGEGNTIDITDTTDTTDTTTPPPTGEGEGEGESTTTTTPPTDGDGDGDDITTPPAGEGEGESLFTYNSANDGPAAGIRMLMGTTAVPEVDRVSFKSSTYNLSVGQDMDIGTLGDIGIDIVPTDADETTVEYTITAGSNFATLDGITITGIEPGMVTLKATAPSGDSATTQVWVRDPEIAQSITYDGANPLVYYIDDAEYTYDDNGDLVEPLTPFADTITVDPAGAPVKWTFRSGNTAFKFDTQTAAITLNENMSGTGTVQATATSGNAVGPVITVTVKSAHQVTALTADSKLYTMDMADTDLRLIDVVEFTETKQGIAEPQLATRPSEYEWKVDSGSAYLSIAADSTLTPKAAGIAVVRVQPKEWAGTTRPSVTVTIVISDTTVLEELYFTAESVELDIDEYYGDGESLLAMLAPDAIDGRSTNLVWSVVSGSAYITTKTVAKGSGDDPEPAHNEMLVKPAKLGTAVVQVVDKGRSGKSAKITITVVDKTYVKELSFQPEGKVLELDLNNPDDITYDLFNGDDVYLLVSPSDTNTTYTWAYIEGNSTIAAVTNKGIVTPKKVGKVVLEVTAVKGGKKARVTIQVKDSNLVETLSFSSATAEIDLYDTDAKLDLSRMLDILPETANTAMKWTVGTSGTATSNTILKVDQAGVITPLKLGSAVVRATAVSGGKIASIVVNVVDKHAPADLILYDGVAAITLDIEPRADLKSYEELDIDYVLMPEGTAKGTVTWKSSATSVATVANNKIKPIKEGTFTLTGTTHNGIVRTVLITLKDVSKATGLTFDPPSTVQLYDETAGPPTINIKSLFEDEDTGERYVNLIPPTGGSADDLVANYTWKVSSTTNATIDSMGYLTPKKLGTVTVTVTETYSKKSASAVVQIVDKTAPTFLQIFSGKTAQTLALGAKVDNAYDPVPYDIINLTVRPTEGLYVDPSAWTVTSSSSTVATAKLVVTDGVPTITIQPLKAGTTTIKVQIKNTTLTASCTLTFVDETIAKKLWFEGLDGTEFELYDDGVAANVVFESWLRHEGLDGVDADVDLTWTVSPTTVMTLTDTKRKDSDTVLKKIGTATVSVTDARSKLTAKATVKVIDSTQPTGIQIFTDKPGTPLRLEITPTTDSTATKIVYEPVPIEYNLLPADDGRNAKVTWTSSSATYAKFGFTGAQPSSAAIEFTPIKAGSVTITAKTDNGFSNARSLVLVDTSVWPADQAFEFSGDAIVNGTLTLDVSDGAVDLNQYLSDPPEGVRFDSYTWTSSSSTYVGVVSTTGAATAKKAGGTATITVTEKRSGRKATLKVVTKDKTIWPADEEFKFTEEYIKLNVGETYELADLLVETPDDVVPSIKWTTSASTTVSVVNQTTGEVKALKGGTEITITATETKSNKKATIKVVTIDPTKIAIFDGRLSLKVEAEPVSYDATTKKTTYEQLEIPVSYYDNEPDQVDFTETSFLPKKATTGAGSIAYTTLVDGKPTLNITGTGTVSVKVVTKAHGSPTTSVTIVDPLLATKLYWKANGDGDAIPTTIDLGGALEETIDLSGFLAWEPKAITYDEPFNDVIWRVTSGNATVTQDGRVTVSKLGTVTVEAKDQRNASAYVRVSIKVTDSNQITSMVAVPKSTTPYVHDMVDDNTSLLLSYDNADLLTIKPAGASGNYQWQITTGNGTIGKIDGSDLGDSVTITTLKIGTMNVKVTDTKTGKSVTIPIKVIDSKRLTSMGFTYKTANKRVDVAEGFTWDLLDVLEAVPGAPSGATLGDVTYKISAGATNAKISGTTLTLLKSSGTFSVQATDSVTGLTATSNSISIVDSTPPTGIAIQYDGGTVTTLTIDKSVVDENNIRELVALLTRTGGGDITQYVTWTSSNPAVVKVLDYEKTAGEANIQALKAGTATITATTHNSKTTTLKVTVK